MARDKNEHYPVVRSGRMDYTGPGITPQIEVNIEQFLSKVNRRLYRQSRSYELKLSIDPTATQTYNIYALSDSWMNEQSLRMAYDMYLENSEDERDRLKKSNLARWQDFRVVSGVNFQQINPVQFTPGLAAQQLAVGEFQITQVVDATGLTKGFSWGGPAPSAYSMLEEYDKAGNAQANPSTSTGDMPYDDLMADDDALMGDFLQTKGNLPPYDAAGVNNGVQWVKVATLATGATQKLSTGFFKAMSGIVLITAGALGNEPVDVSTFEWTAKAGDYKGVHAPAILDV